MGTESNSKPIASFWRAFRRFWPLTVAAFLAFIYLFGVAASVYVGFGPPRSILSVFQQVRVTDLLNPHAQLSFHASAASVGLVATFFYCCAKRLSTKASIAILCTVAPMLWFELEKGTETFAMWILSVVSAPFWLWNALAGRMDGEYYAEGFLALTALGWWSLLWVIITLRIMVPWFWGSFLSKTKHTPSTVQLTA